MYFFPFLNCQSFFFRRGRSLWAWLTPVCTGMRLRGRGQGGAVRRRSLTALTQCAPALISVVSLCSWLSILSRYIFEPENWDLTYLIQILDEMVMIFPLPLLQDSFDLVLITRVGLVLSLVCLFLCILTFQFCRSIQGTRNSIHLHLSICLFIADLVFLCGISSTHNQVCVLYLLYRP